MKRYALKLENGLYLRGVDEPNKTIMLTADVCMASSLGKKNINVLYRYVINKFPDFPPFKIVEVI